jgi:hypothetical protein
MICLKFCDIYRQQNTEQANKIYLHFEKYIAEKIMAGLRKITLNIPINISP